MAIILQSSGHRGTEGCGRSFATRQGHFVLPANRSRLFWSGILDSGCDNLQCFVPAMTLNRRLLCDTIPVLAGSVRKTISLCVPSAQKCCVRRHAMIGCPPCHQSHQYPGRAVVQIKVGNTPATQYRTTYRRCVC